VWVRAGEANEGWIPARFVSEAEPHRALCDYDATELTVAEGDPLLLGREVDGWIRCSTTGGEVGWLPAYCCEPVHESEHD
jgi:hypothetical protein